MSSQKPENASKKKLAWKWGKGVAALTQADFGDPINGGTSYSICLYDYIDGVPALRAGFSVAAGGLCGTTPKPCWKPLGKTKGWAYKMRGGNSDGISAISLKGGDAGKPKLAVKGAGLNLPLPPAVSATQYFAEEPSVAIQLHANGTSNCWTSTFSLLGTKKNDGIKFSAKAAP